MSSKSVIFCITILISNSFDPNSPIPVNCVHSLPTLKPIIMTSPLHNEFDKYFNKSESVINTSNSGVVIFTPFDVVINSLSNDSIFVLSPAIAKNIRDNYTRFSANASAFTVVVFDFCSTIFN